MGNFLSEWLLNGEYSENAVLTNNYWECVETIWQPPKQKCRVKRQSRPPNRKGSENYSGKKILGPLRAYGFDSRLGQNAKADFIFEMRVKLLPLN